VTGAIRQERDGDEAAIRSVHAVAFARGTSGETPPEADLVDALRDSEAWIPALSIVAAEDGEIIGHVCTTRAHVEDEPILALGPIGVLPAWQRSGVGSALIAATVEAGNRLHEPIIVLLGSTDYYPRFGFVPAAPLGIVSPEPSWGDNLQALPLEAYHPVPGRLRYAQPFDAV
jgi:putative acetyltransferase